MFSVTNAANSYNRNYIKIDGTYNKFKELFSDSIIIRNFYGSRIKNRDGLKACYPTDVQAEVLVKDKIPLIDVIEICFSSEESLELTKGALSFGCNSFIPKLSVEKDLFNERPII